MHAITIVEKEGMSLKESWEGYKGGVQRRMGEM